MAHPILAAIARSFLAGEPSVEQIVSRTAQTLGRPWRWLRPVARSFVEACDGETRPRQREVIEFLLHDPVFLRVWMQKRHEMRIAHALIEPLGMRPVPAAADWEIPAIETPGDLAAWLEIEPDELDWFADLKDLTRKEQGGRGGRLRHYHYKMVEKSSGTFRLLEVPKPRLKAIQRRILAGILDWIPPHPAAHGFRRGHSIKSFATPHSGRRVVLRMDLRDFFPSISGVRVQAFFRTAGYPERVADLLAGLCTNTVPREAWDPPAAQTRDLYLRPHLPQGAPTSPALANLMAYRVDCRLSGLARSAGATYTRYADDLAFSGDGDFERSVERFSIHVAAILEEEGFAVHHRKTRIMRQSVRQHIAGLVTNQRVNIHRADFDRLKAVLTNCVRHGIDSQNRDGSADFRAHLTGKVAFVEMIHPARGARLRELLRQIP
ncbi:MAG TPA: reverse transcriptase family protein [Verrucomicrobiae bacterium]|nr:reverse transcriptase family protein [Verrucomicrobiae bacterium]